MAQDREELLGELISTLARARRPHGYIIASTADLDRLLESLLRTGPTPPAQGDVRLMEDLGDCVWRDVAPDELAALPRTGEPVAWRPETTSENIARDMREGRFPERSPARMLMIGNCPDCVSGECTMNCSSAVFAHPVPEQDGGLPTVAPNTERLREYAADFMRHSTDDQCNRTCRVRVDDLSVLLAWVAQFPTLPQQEAV